MYISVAACVWISDELQIQFDQDAAEGKEYLVFSGAGLAVQACESEGAVLVQIVKHLGMRVLTLPPVSELPGGFVLGLHPQDFWFSRSQAGLQLCIPNEFLGGAGLAFPETSLWEPLSS